MQNYAKLVDLIRSQKILQNEDLLAKIGTAENEPSKVWNTKVKVKDNGFKNYPDLLFTALGTIGDASAVVDES